MERKSACDFDQGLLNLDDQYVQSRLDRWEFIEKASKYAIGGVTAAA